MHMINAAAPRLSGDRRSFGRTDVSLHERSHCGNCRRLREERDYAVEEARRWREAFTGEVNLARFMQLGLTKHEAQILAALYARPRMSKAGLMLALYGDDPNGGPEEKIIDVYVCKLRAKMAEGSIETVWGFGYKLTHQARVALDAHVEATP